MNTLQLKFKEIGINADYGRLMSGGSNAEKRVRMHAAALIEMACRLDEIYLEAVRL